MVRHVSVVSVLRHKLEIPSQHVHHHKFNMLGLGVLVCVQSRKSNTAQTCIALNENSEHDARARANRLRRSLAENDVWMDSDSESEHDAMACACTELVVDICAAV